MTIDKHEDAQKWVNEKTVAQMLSCSCQTLRNSRAKKTMLPYYKRGRSVLYKIIDVINYMEKNRIEIDE